MRLIRSGAARKAATAIAALVAIPVITALAATVTAAPASASAAHPGAAGARHPSTVSVSARPGTAVAGTSVTLAATVRSAGATPTGTVSFATGRTRLCAGRLSHGSTRCTARFPAAGTYTVTGSYSGDATHAGAAGTARVTVTKVATTTRITLIEPDRVLAGRPATVSVAVTNKTAGTAAATGTVKVTPSNPADVGVAGYSCTVTLTSRSGGKGTCKVTPPVGTYGFIFYNATYSGDAAHAGSVYDGMYKVTVPDITTTVVAFSPGEGTVGEPDTITATVTNQAGDNISPSAGGTGTVTFSIGGTPIAGCSDVPLTYSAAAGNTATCFYTPTAAGSVTVVAAYSGDDVNLASSGSAGLSSA